MPPTRAALLVRISDDKAEDAKGVGRQEDDGRAHGDRLGWEIAEVVTENDTSAFKRRRVQLPDGTYALRVVRPALREVLDKLASGEIDGLIVYDLDRYARDPRDLEDLIDIVEQKRVPVTSVTGSLRLENDADVTMARVMIAIANKSSRDTSRRVKRKHQELAAEGKPGGGGIRPFGYQRGGLLIEPSEKAILVEMAERIIAGWSLYEITADLTARQVPTVRGGPWTSRSVKTAVTKPRVAGLRSRFDETTGREEIIGMAVWPAILERDTFEEVVGILATRGHGGSNRLTRWLTGVLHCKLCDHGLTGCQGNGGPRYWCSTVYGGCGKIAVKAEHAETEVTRQVLEYLANPDVLISLKQASAAPDAVAAVRQEIALDEDMLKELARQWATRAITLPEYTEARRIIEKRLNESKRVVVGMAPRALRQLLAGGDVPGKWETLGPAERREVTLAILPDGYTVGPAIGQRNRFNPNRLKVRDRPVN